MVERGRETTKQELEKVEEGYHAVDYHNRIRTFYLIYLVKPYIKVKR